MVFSFRENDKSSDESDSDESMTLNDFIESDSEDEEEAEEKLEAEADDGDKQESDDEDDIIKAIKAAKNRCRDHPPAITSEDYIVDISMHPAKNIIALGDILGDVELYEYNDEENKLVSTLELHLKSCRAVEFDSEGTTLYTASKDKSIMLTDMATQKLKRCYENSHEDPIYCLKCINEYIFVTGDDGGTVKMWDPRKPEPISSFKIGEDYISDFISNETQKYLVCAGGDGVLTTIDMKGRKIYVRSEDYDSDLTCLGLFRTETKLLVGSTKGKLYMFNWKEFGYHSDEYSGLGGSVSCMVPVTENIAVTAGEDGVLRASHLFPQRPLGVVGQHRLPAERLDMSHDGRLLASCSHDDGVHFWNISYFETIDQLIDVHHKQDKRRAGAKNLPSSNAPSNDFFSGLV